MDGELLLGLGTLALASLGVISMLFKLHTRVVVIEQRQEDFLTYIREILDRVIPAPSRPR